VRFGRASFHLPSPIQREVGIAAGSTVYLIGGLNDTGTSVSTVEQVDLSRGRVQVIGQVLHRFHDGAGAWIGNRLFVFGGGTGAGSDAVQSFSPSQRLAEVEGALPRTLSDLSTASVDGVTYLIGGYDGVAPQRTIYATTDGRHFHRACLLPQGLRYAAVATTGNTLVIAGGETSRGPTDAILAFDPSTGAITIVGHLPQPLGHASAFAAGGVVYVAGGVDGAGRTLRSVVAVDTASGRVSDAGRLPAPLSDAAALVLTGRAWLFGGLRGRAVSDVLVASIPPT
jgi:N-acetylneuraminic acid mutarotase